jgi:hypothetical protein
VDALLGSDAAGRAGDESAVTWPGATPWTRAMPADQGASKAQPTSAARVNPAAELVEITGSWSTGDLALVVESPSGKVYSTEEPGTAVQVAGGARQGFRTLRVPAERGVWSIGVHDRGVPAGGEPYTLAVSAPAGEVPSLDPLQGRYDEGATVRVEVARCPSCGAKGTLYGADGGAVEFTLAHEPARGSCVGEVEAPRAAGMYPVAVDVPGATATPLWTTAQVGDTDDVLRQRDRWRVGPRPWAAASSGGGWFFPAALLGVGAIVGGLVIARRKDGAHHHRRPARANRGYPATDGAGVMIIPPGESPVWIALPVGEIRLGRDPGNDVVLSDSRISRFHLAVVSGPDGVFVRNLSHSEGTRLDGVPLAPGQAASFRHGSRLRLPGGTVMEPRHR